MRALIAALALAALPAVSLAAPPDANACAAQIKAQTAHRRPAAAACWHVGPLALGMTPEEVAALIGPPDHEGAGPPDPLPAQPAHAGYRDAVYLFPRDLAQRLQREPQAELSLRSLTISYFEGRAVRIDTVGTVEIRSRACPVATPDVKIAGAPDGFAPFRSFAGVREGDPTSLLTRRFGKPMTVNRPGDFYTYMPTPLTVDIDLDHRAVGGFTIGADTEAVFLGGVTKLELTRDPATCRVTGFGFLP